MKPVHLVALMLALALTAAIAQPQAQKGAILVKSVAETEVEVKNAKGEIEKKREPVKLAVPGSQVIYTTTFTNQGGKPAGNVVLNNPVPPNTRYIDGSAFGESTTVTFSADGGKTFAAREQLRVKAADGKERSAVAADYTHIRWVYNGLLAPNAAGTAGFRVVIL